MTFPRPLLKTLVALAALVALLVPFAVALATGWIEIHLTPWNEQPGPDPTPIEAWVLLALVYLVWTPLVMVGARPRVRPARLQVHSPRGRPAPPAQATAPPGCRAQVPAVAGGAAGGRACGAPRTRRQVVPRRPAQLLARASEPPKAGD